MYKNVNQWNYVHLDAGHEATGQHAITLDEDLAKFMDQTLDDRTFLLLSADHGMRYGDWYSKEAAYYEHKLPVFFIIAPTKLLNKIPNSYANLLANSYHLTSKVDIRATVLDLAHHVFGDETFIPEVGSSLFRQRISDDVT